MLSGSLIKKVILPPGAVSLDDVDLDQVSVDYVLSCVKKGGNFCVIGLFFLLLYFVRSNLVATRGDTRFNEYIECE